jgi:hypothetical protein
MKNYSDYRKASRHLMNNMFDKKLIKRLKKTKLKAFDWEGLDVNDTDITGTFPNIKERFTSGWIEYFEEHNENALDLFIQSVFHYGFQQGADKFKNK